MSERQDKTIDLQSHSLYSDGELPAGEVVERAADAGVVVLALTDHDTVDGVQEALEKAAEVGIELICATEISAVDGEWEDLHVLGLGIDHRDERLRERLAEARADRELRSERMGARLAELGFEVDTSAMDVRRAEGKPIGRPHLAAGALAHPANAGRLADEGHDNVSSFIPAYLIPGAPAYVGRTKPRVQEAIGWIHDAGGLAVWAHPFWDIKDEQVVLAAIDRYREAGLDGVECFYPSHDAHQTQLLADRCVELDLLRTPSSDYHGPSHRMFAQFLAYELYDREPELGRLRADLAS